MAKVLAPVLLTPRTVRNLTDLQDQLLEILKIFLFLSKTVGPRAQLLRQFFLWAIPASFSFFFVLFKQLA